MLGYPEPPRPHSTHALGLARGATHGATGRVPAKPPTPTGPRPVGGGWGQDLSLNVPCAAGSY